MKKFLSVKEISIELNSRFKENCIIIDEKYKKIKCNLFGKEEIILINTYNLDENSKPFKLKIPEKSFFDDQGELNDTIYDNVTLLLFYNSSNPSDFLLYDKEMLLKGMGILSKKNKSTLYPNDNDFPNKPEQKKLKDYLEEGRWFQQASYWKIDLNVIKKALYTPKITFVPEFIGVEFYEMFFGLESGIEILSLFPLPNSNVHEIKLVDINGELKTFVFSYKDLFEFVVKYIDSLTAEETQELNSEDTLPF